MLSFLKGFVSGFILFSIIFIVISLIIFAAISSNWILLALIIPVIGGLICGIYFWSEGIND